jgi:drug/metabolite transporter (DMT)-like permease
LAHLRERIEAELDRVDVPAVAVIQSLAGAACYAVASILQQQAARVQPDELSLRPGLLTRLMRSGRWLAGIGCDIGGWLLQFFALRSASLALVSPLFVVGLPMSIIGAAWADRRRPIRAEWMASVVVVIGLVAFIATARPGPGHPRASGSEWTMLGVATIACVGAAILLARGTPRRRAFMLGVATGILFGVTAAITERTAHLLNHGVLHALTTWVPYTLAVVSIIGLLLNQSAFQAGELRWSLPVITVLEPVVAIVISQVLFAEHIASDPLDVAGQVLGLAAMTAGVFWLAQVGAPETSRPVGPDPVVSTEPAVSTGPV